MNNLISYLLALSIRYSNISRSIRAGFLGYLITVVLMLAALWLRFAMAPVDAGLQYITFFPTVTIAAIVAGYKAGWLATVIGMMFGTYFFTTPYYSFTDEALKIASWGNLAKIANMGQVAGHPLSFGKSAPRETASHAENSLCSSSSFAVAPS